MPRPRESEPCRPDWAFESRSPSQTETLARSMAERVSGGEVILLRGALGAGKTFFAAALGDALGVREPMTSPSYVLLRSYETRRKLTVHHMDFYRLSGDDDLEALGIEECVEADALVLVEWPERCPSAFADFTLELTFVVTGDERRNIEGRWGTLPFPRDDWPPASPQFD